MGFTSADFEGFSGTVEFDALLSKSTFYRIGGPAKVLATPKNFSDLQIIHRFIRKHQLRFFILGWGSNLLFSDQGFDGVVIRMKHLFTEIEKIGENKLKLGASVGGSTLLRQAQEKGYQGLSLLTGIPGSVGVMVAMNAGTHLAEMKDICLSVESIDLSRDELTIQTHAVQPSSFSYRRNHFLSASDLVISCTVKYQAGEPSAIKKEIDELYQRRKQSQPVDYPSCGSVFMNPKGGPDQKGMHAWQVIDQLGLRGHRIGNAQFAEKHSNFIINLGGALATDVKSLIDLAKARAKNELNIELHEEVKYIE